MKRMAIKSLSLILTALLLLNVMPLQSMQAITGTTKDDLLLNAVPMLSRETGTIEKTQTSGIITETYASGYGDWDGGSLPLQDEPRFAEDRVIVKIANNMRTRAVTPDLGVAYSEIRMLNPSKQTTNTQTFTTAAMSETQNNVFVLTLAETGADAVERALETLNANPAVEIAEPDYLYKLSGTPNDPQYNAQYALQKINAEQAWDITTGSKSVVVGIIDSGIEGTHPDLIGNLWVNPNPNHGGYINDIHGYDFTGRVGGIPTDYDGHGTHVAGIVGAKGNNGIGVSGINWDVSLAWLGASAGVGYINISAVIEALNYANNHDIMITNNSYGGYDYSKIFEEAINNYIGLFVAAAGNETNNNDYKPAYPASYDCPNIISVASIDSDDKLSSFSNYGANSIDIAAPGGDIMSTYIGRTYQYLGGTSMASPYVAGIAALMMSVHPEYSKEQVRELLIASSQPVDSLRNCVIYGSGIVDAYAAVRTDINSLLYITFDFNDGESELDIIKIIQGKKLIESFPLKDGYVFEYWSLDMSGDNPFDFDTVLNGNITLYAQWIEIADGMFLSEFPDINFCNEVLRLLNGCDSGSRVPSSIITDEDYDMLALITELYINSMGINSLEGILHFTGLKILFCYGNQLAELDVSQNTALTDLRCFSNLLTELDVSNNAAITLLACDLNQLMKLDVSQNPVLSDLYCTNNLLTNLDVSNCTALKNLYCYNNQLTSLDLSKNIDLISLSCSNNQMTTLDVSNNIALWTLQCDGNQLTILDLSNNAALIYLRCDYNKIYMLNILKNAVLEIITCSENYLTTLDVSACTSLEILDCNNNQLTAIDVSQNPLLEWFNCSYNQIPALNVSENIALSFMLCSGNRLATLDVSKNILLECLDCSGNQLTELDISKNTALRGLVCSNNRLTELYLWSNTSLEGLFCPGNLLTVLDISKNTHLGNYNGGINYRGWIVVGYYINGFNCSGNQLTKLDVSNNTELTYLACSNNLLIELDISHNTTLAEINCSGNPLTKIDAKIDGYSIKVATNGSGAIDLYYLSSSNTLYAQAQSTSPALFMNWTQDGNELSSDTRYDLQRDRDYDLVANFYSDDAETPIIDIHPEDIMVKAGESVILSMAASVTKGSLSYQWYENTSKATDGGTAIDGAVNASYDAPTTKAGTRYYYCVVTNTDDEATGSKTAYAISNVVSVTVNSVTTLFIVASKSTASIGSEVSFTITMGNAEDTDLSAFSFNIDIPLGLRYKPGSGVINPNFAELTDLAVVTFNDDSTLFVSGYGGSSYNGTEDIVIATFVCTVEEAGTHTVTLSDPIGYSYNNAQIDFNIVPATITTAEVLVGDVNEDGQITIIDVDMVYRAFRGLLVLDDTQLLVADVNKDSNITIIDVDMIYRAFRGLLVL